MVEGNDYWIDDDESIFALSIFFFAAVPGSDGSNDNENVSIDVYLDAFLHPPSPLSPSNSSSSPTCLRWTFSPPPLKVVVFFTCFQTSSPSSTPNKSSSAHLPPPPSPPPLPIN